MRRSGQNDRPGAVVRRDRQMPGFGHRGDLLGLGEPPHQAMSSITTPATPVSRRSRKRSAAERLGGADRRARSLGVALQRAEAVHLDRVFVPEGSKGASARAIVIAGSNCHIE